MEAFIIKYSSNNFPRYNHTYRLFFTLPMNNDTLGKSIRDSRLIGSYKLNLFYFIDLAETATMHI